MPADWEGSPLTSLAWEELMNAGTPLLVAAPAVVGLPRRQAAKLLVLAVGCSVLIDIDHAVKAGSVTVHAMTAIGVRPVTHSLTFALAAAAAFVAARRPLAGWMVVCGLVSHLVRDASGGGTPILWPVLDATRVAWWLYPAGVGALLGGSALIRARRARRAPPAKPAR